MHELEFAESRIVAESRITAESRINESEETWAIVLAGGEGQRLRPLTRRLYGDGRPKQYAALTGPESLLRQTLQRAAMLVPPERIVVVSRDSHARYLTADSAALRGVHVLLQPSDRGTAAGILLGAHWIGARAHGATAVVFPADHFVLDAASFIQSVDQIAAYVQEHPEWLAVLGVRPTEPERDYGWIEPGERLGSIGAGSVYRVERFEEKPPEEVARQLFARGWLWNTLVFAASVDGLIDAGRRSVPLLHDRFARLSLFFGTQYERWALRQAYLFAPAADFSRAILASPEFRTAVADVPGLTWCDLGTPERVTSALRWVASAPPHVAAL